MSVDLQTILDEEKTIIKDYITPSMEYTVQAGKDLDEALDIINNKIKEKTLEIKKEESLEKQKELQKEKLVMLSYKQKVLHFKEELKQVYNQLVSVGKDTKTLYGVTQKAYKISGGDIF